MISSRHFSLSKVKRSILISRYLKYSNDNNGARGSVVDATNRNAAGSIPDEVIEFFQFT
jgi:hypothetical protein